MPKGEITRFDFRHKTFAVYHTADGKLFATDGICTHGNAHLSDGMLHGDVIECEPPKMQAGRLIVWVDKVYDDGRRHKRPKDIDHLRSRATGPEANADKVPRMNPGSPALAVWVDASSDFVAIVVEARVVVFVLWLLPRTLLVG